MKNITEVLKELSETQAMINAGDADLRFIQAKHKGTTEFRKNVLVLQAEHRRTGNKKLIPEAQ